MLAARAPRAAAVGRTRASSKKGGERSCKDADEEENEEEEEEEEEEEDEDEEEEGRKRS